MYREVQEEEQRAQKLAQSKHVGEKYGKEKPRPGVVTSDFKGTKLISTITCMLSLARNPLKLSWGLLRIEPALSRIEIRTPSTCYLSKR